MLKSNKFLYILNAILLAVVIGFVYLIINEISLQQKEKLISNNTNIPTPPDVDSKIKESDLSYILVTVDDENSSIEVIDETGNRVGEDFAEGPLSLTADGNPSGESLRSFYLEKLSSGNYDIKINSNKEDYLIDIYLYDKNGEVKNEIINGKSGASNLEIEFDKDDSNNSKITTSF